MHAIISQSNQQWHSEDITGYVSYLELHIVHVFWSILREIHFKLSGKYSPSTHVAETGSCSEHTMYCIHFSA